MHPAVGERRADDNAPVALFGLHARGNFDGPVVKQLGFAMREGNMHRVVLHVVDEVAGARVSLDPKFTALFEISITRKVRRLALTQICENEPQILANRIAPNTRSFCRRRVLGRDLNALPRAIVLPAVKTTTNLIALDPPRRKLHASMRATKRDQVWCSGFAAIECEVLAHDAERFRPTGFDFG